MTTYLIILAAAAGAGMSLTIAALMPWRPTLAAEIADLDATDTATATSPQASRLDSIITSDQLRSDLACLNDDTTGLMRRAGRAIGYTAITSLALTALALSHDLIAAQFIAVLALAAAALPPTIVLARTHTRAESQRDEYRRALATFLDMTAVSLAGGAGIDSALHEAAGSGTGKAFSAIRQQLNRARLLHTTPWATLAELGQRIGVSEYQQLAATIGIAGTEGAAVRTSLIARTATLRKARRATYKARTDANTQKMAAPTVLIGIGFLSLILFAAMHSIMTGL